MKKNLLTLIVLQLFAITLVSNAQIAPNLGTAGDYSLLADSSISSNNNSYCYGNIGTKSIVSGNVMAQSVYFYRVFSNETLIGIGKISIIK